MLWFKAQQQTVPIIINIRHVISWSVWKAKAELSFYCWQILSRLELKATAQTITQHQLAHPIAYLSSTKIVKFPLKATHLLNSKLISWKQATGNHFR